ncbi:MAG TPA: hypothetical protein VMX96_07690 [Dehalococcoidia bacterium]|nr:hypothetical protein [Dehalococcoidia bacterium]
MKSTCMGERRPHGGISAGGRLLGAGFDGCTGVPLLLQSCSVALKRVVTRVERSKRDD